MGLNVRWLGLRRMVWLLLRLRLLLPRNHHRIEIAALFVKSHFRVAFLLLSLLVWYVS